MSHSYRKEEKSKAMPLVWFGFDARERSTRLQFRQQPESCPAHDRSVKCGATRFVHYILKHAGIERLVCPNGHTLARALDETTMWVLETP